MRVVHPVLRWGLGIVAAGGCGVAALADGAEELLDIQPIWAGPGYRGVDRGLAPMAFQSSGVQLISWVSLGEFSPTPANANVVEGYVSTGGIEYALLGLSNGTGVIRLADPTDPVIVGHIPGPESLWRDVRVFGNFAYSVSEGGSGIQVISLANVDTTGPVLVNTVLSGGSHATHTVFINKTSGYLYRAGGGNSVRVYNLNNNPANPQYIGSFDGGRYCHEIDVVSYTSGPYAGKEIAFLSNGSHRALTIYDVTNKSNPQQLSSIGYSDSGYTHQSGLSADKQYLFLNDEFDEKNNNYTSRMRIFNVANLSSPFEAGWATNGNNAIDHNLYTLGNRIFCSNYRSGLRIFDATNPLAPVEVAYFDTYPTDDQKKYNSLWDNYPYLPSGIVLGADMEKGLFVWWVGEAMLDFAYPVGRPQTVMPDVVTPLMVEIAGAEGHSVLPGSARLHVDNGSGFQVVPLTHVKGDLYEAALPATECGRTLSYFISAKSENGLVWRDPPAAAAESYLAISAFATPTVFFDDFETDSGWTVGSPTDTAFDGLWVRIDPVGSIAQPEDDHTPNGTHCWITGDSYPGALPGWGDVDGGPTTLTSPAYDLTGYSDPIISYWRWYSTIHGGPQLDQLQIDISPDGGATWVNVEKVGPGGPQAVGGWLNHQFRVVDWIPLSANVRLRVIATETVIQSVVEAAFDDFEIREVYCQPCAEDLNADGKVDQADLAALLASYELNDGGDIDGDGDTDQADLAALLARYGSNCP